jgi:hypothetical protein
MGGMIRPIFSVTGVSDYEKRVTTQQKVIKMIPNSWQALQGKWHRVYFDNFFTSKRLLRDLESAGIYGCGLVRKDRKQFPQA